MVDEEQCRLMLRIVVGTFYNFRPQAEAEFQAKYPDDYATVMRVLDEVAIEVTASHGGSNKETSMEVRRQVKCIVERFPAWAAAVRAYAESGPYLNRDRRLQVFHEAFADGLGIRAGETRAFYKALRVNVDVMECADLFAGEIGFEAYDECDKAAYLVAIPERARFQDAVAAVWHLFSELM